MSKRISGIEIPVWLFIVVAALVVVGIAGGVLAGGIFTIVLVPIAVIVLVAGVIFRGMGSATQPTEGGEPTNAPLPHSAGHEPGHVRTSPEALTDARRAEQ